MSYGDGCAAQGTPGVYTYTGSEHDETVARADNLREQMERLTTALAETEARLAEFAATRKVIDGLTLPDHATAPARPPPPPSTSAS